MKIAILGAECTGKTQLVRTLPQALVGHFDDSPVLMAAIYRDVLFNDPSLYASALEHHRDYDLTLVMGLDLPWVAQDGVQRHGAHSQKSVDARLREILDANAVPYSLVYGTGAHRTGCALQAIAHHRNTPRIPRTSAASRWRWNCEKCSDADCEHRLFNDLVHANSLGG